MDYYTARVNQAKREMTRFIYTKSVSVLESNPAYLIPSFSKASS